MLQYIFQAPKRTTLQVTSKSDKKCHPDCGLRSWMQPFFSGCACSQHTLTNCQKREGDIAITRVVPGGQALCEELEGAD